MRERGSDREYVVVMLTTANMAEAERITQCLLDERLIACANIVGSASSLFWWAGNVERAEEFVILMKSRLDLFERLVEKVKALHSYEVPEIIALPIVQGSPSYVQWLDDALKPADK